MIVGMICSVYSIPLEFVVLIVFGFESAKRVR